MSKRFTIKDIAAEAGVSIGSVHCALSGKPGVSAETRDRIERIAREHNYKPNTVASSLKRGTLKIAAAIPGLEGENTYFFSDVWQGVKDYLAEMRDFNIELIPVPFSGSKCDTQDQRLHEILERTDIDGLVSVGYTPADGLVSLQEYRKRSIPFVIASSDIPDSGRFCCVRPNYFIVGRMLAELILQRIGSVQPVLICAGNPTLVPHYEIVDGFESYLRSAGAENPVYKLYSESDNTADADRVRQVLSDRYFAASFAVTSRDSIRLAQALLDTNRWKHMFSIGMDVFKENKCFLQRGVFSHLIQNNPYKCSFLATKILVQYLLDNDKRPARDVIEVNSELVFKSDVDMFNSVNYRLQM